MLLFLPGAKEFSVPVTVKPDFWRTLSEAALSLATRACSGRMGTRASSSSRARLAMPRPQAAPVDPVGDLSPAVEDEGSDAPDELVIASDRAQCGAGRGPHRGHMRIERGPVAGVIRSERGHPDRLGISHLIEQRAEVRVRDRPQGDNWHIS